LYFGKYRTRLKFYFVFLSLFFFLTDRADVTVLREHYEETRHKREAGDVSSMPTSLSVQVTSEDSMAVFRLARQALLKPRLLNGHSAADERISPTVSKAQHFFSSKFVS
jgi:hypothetical protein